MCNITVSAQVSINALVDKLVLTKSCLTFDLQGQTLAAKKDYLQWRQLDLV